MGRPIVAAIDHTLLVRPLFTTGIGRLAIFCGPDQGNIGVWRAQEIPCAAWFGVALLAGPFGPVLRPSPALFFLSTIIHHNIYRVPVFLGTTHCHLSPTQSLLIATAAYTLSPNKMPIQIFRINGEVFAVSNRNLQLFCVQNSKRDQIISLIRFFLTEIFFDANVPEQVVVIDAVFETAIDQVWARKPKWLFFQKKLLGIVVILERFQWEVIVGKIRSVNWVNLLRIFHG